MHFVFCRFSLTLMKPRCDFSGLAIFIAHKLVRRLLLYVIFEGNSVATILYYNTKGCLIFASNWLGLGAPRGGWKATLLVFSRFLYFSLSNGSSVKSTPQIVSACYYHSRNQHLRCVNNGPTRLLLCLWCHYINWIWKYFSIINTLLLQYLYSACSLNVFYFKYN